MRVFIFFLFFFMGWTASAQDLTGIWRGHFKSTSGNRMMDSLLGEDRYKFEVQLDQRDKAFRGVTYSYKTTVFYGKASCYGALNPKTKKVLLEETKILEVKSNGDGACIMTCFLQYSKVGNEEFMEGNYTGISITDSSHCGKGTVFLRKVPVSDFYKEPFLAEKEKAGKPVPKPNPPVAKTNPVIPKTPPAQYKKTTPVTPRVPAKPKPPVASVPKKSDQLKIIPEDSLKKILEKPAPVLNIPKVLVTRKNEVVRTITTSAQEVYIKIYDNGTIDNDTVSVYVDKKQVIKSQRLTEKPIVVKITLDEENDMHELIMVAENLGEIPPNTSLMVVSAGSEQYEVRITSTEQKNAAVIFQYKPK